MELLELDLPEEPTLKSADSVPTSIYGIVDPYPGSDSDSSDSFTSSCGSNAGNQRFQFYSLFCCILHIYCILLISELCRYVGVE